ncbi:MAG TPA: glutathione S-transferase, partial [Polyangia bacterium]
MTLKLYFSNGSCSLASHIALEEANAAFETQRINLREKEQKTPAYLAVNPKGKVPALAVDGAVLTENPAIISYVADTHPDAKLLAAPGELARAKAQEWLAWCSSTVHISF